MTAAAATIPDDVIYIPDVASTRFYIGALAKLSVLQYFVAEAAVIGAWAGPEPYSRRTGLISDLGARGCGVFQSRDVCSPAHVLMNASFVVQGLGMVIGALLLGSALLCLAARPGGRIARGPGHGPGQGPGLRTPRTAGVAAAVAARVLTGAAGSGTVIVGLVPEDAGSVWHGVGAVMYFAAGALALLVLGCLWLRQTPLGWFVLACGALSLGALITGGLTGMHVPEPGTLERLMGYPITVGLAAVGLVIAQRVRQERVARKAQKARQARKALKA
ncbi:DUF998 domain-containing protein [Pseudarthrobacter sp. S9]|uniref:DUF998 domain-containing protein n=1 Tax=Pseudarthrobacter sp. S9 TaxID=3418421 RepID=UPI003D013CF6